MAKMSKHEKVMRDELLIAAQQLEAANTEVKARRIDVERALAKEENLRQRVKLLESMLSRADAKLGDVEEAE